MGFGAAAVATPAFVSSCSGGESGSSSGDVALTIAIVSGHAGGAEFFREQFDNFEKANPGISVEMIENPPAQNINAVELMFQQGNPPDIFYVNGANNLDRLHGRGYTAALDDYIDDDFRSRFPEGSLDPLISGLHREGGLHSLPLVSGKWRSGSLLAYNQAILEENGLDRPPETFEELEQMSYDITRNGGGDYYGCAFRQSDAREVGFLQAAAGPSSIGEPSGLGLDLTTGQAGVSDASLVDLVELYRQLQTDKIVMPGWESWDGERVFTEFAREKIAFYAAAEWHVNEIANLNPELNFGLAPLPVPAAGRQGYLGLRAAFSPIWAMSAESARPDEAWLLMDFLVSEEFQRAYFETFRSFTAVESVWRDSADLSEVEQQMITIHDETVRRAPDPITDGSPAVKMLMTELIAQPDLRWHATSVEAITRGEDFAPKATALDEEIDSFLDTQIEQLASAGGEITGDDLSYPEWDPMQDWAPAT